MAGVTGRHRRIVRPAQLPAKFDRGFLSRIDKRFRPAIRVGETIEELSTALADDLSPQQKMIIQRVAWAHQRLQEIEIEYAKGMGFDEQTWVALNTSLFAGLKLLGIHRRAKPVPRALEYAAQVAAKSGGTP